MGIIIGLITFILFTLGISCVILFAIVTFQFYIILAYSTRYPYISKKIYSQLFRIYITPSYHRFFYKRFFDKWFNRFYSYEDIIKTRDKKFIWLMDSQKRITRIAGIVWFILAFLMIIISLITIILFIIAIIINGKGAFN